MPRECMRGVIDGPALTASTGARGSAQGTSLRRPRPLIGGVGLAIGWHGGVATASGVVLMELARSVPHSRWAEVLGHSACRYVLWPFRIGDYAGRCVNAPGFWRRVGTISAQSGRWTSGAPPGCRRSGTWRRRRSPIGCHARDRTPSSQAPTCRAAPRTRSRPRRWLRSTNRRSGLWEEVRNARLAGVRLQ